MYVCVSALWTTMVFHDVDVFFTY